MKEILDSELLEVLKIQFKDEKLLKLSVDSLMLMIDSSIKIVYEMGMEVHREDDF